ncbi:hypothetical protein CBS101457_006085 [Exobasidium rhododendri]|nr:hypothetical protein CBS101457_006085 [Exobasidium rhododendri]
MTDGLSALPAPRVDRLSFSSHSPHARSPLGSISTDFRRRSSSRRTDASSSSFSRPILTSRPVSLWTHEPPNFSSHELVLNPDLIAAVGGISESSELFEVRHTEGDLNGNALADDVDGEEPSPLAGHKKRRKDASRREAREVMRKSFLFKASQGVGDLACIERSGAQLQLSISRSIAGVFGFYNRCEVILSKVPRAEHVISHVELYFRDQYIGRADMWRLSTLLEDSCVYVGQKVTLANCVRATVGRIFINERKVMSGYIGQQTRTIFRSESAKFYVFIQMATEMWDFDEDGELYYEKALSGFLPELYRRWQIVPANHVVSVILFARVHYDISELHMLQESELPLRQEEDGKKRWYIDYYKVIVDLESDCDWPKMLTLLKEEFFRFSHDVLLLRRPVAGPDGAPWLEEQYAHLLRRDRALLAGTLSSSHEGNILEAINLSLNPFNEHYIDRDLNRTGLDLLIITAGTGHFDVNKQLLRMTTERLIDNGIGLDLVCLTKMPLHSVPLFHFQSQVPMPEAFGGGGGGGAATAAASSQSKPSSKKRRSTATAARPPVEQSAPPDPLYFDPKHASAAASSSSFGVGSRSKSSGLVDFYGIPHWVDCSFYNLQQDKPFRADRFIPRCKMHEVQMLGLMENEISDISIPYIDFAKVPGVVSSGGYFPPPSKSYGVSSKVSQYGSSNTKPSRSYILATDHFGDLTGLDPKEQRRLLREQFDKETFRDLENVPSTYRSWVVQGAGDRSLASLSASPPPIFRESSFNSTPSRRGQLIESLHQRKQETPPVLRRGGVQTAIATPPSPGRAMKSSRTMRLNPPQLESHDEHPSTMDASTSKSTTPLALSPDQSKQLSPTSSEDSLVNRGRTKAESSLPASRSSSVRSTTTIVRGLRPLEPMGKARALVAPSNFDSFNLLDGGVGTAKLSEEASKEDRPASAKASSSLRRDRGPSDPDSPIKARSGYGGWLWGALKGTGKASQSEKPEVNRMDGVENSGGIGSSSDASRKIQLLLKSASTQRPAPAPSNPSSASTPLMREEEVERKELERSDSDETLPSPISIPSQSVTADKKHDRGKGTASASSATESTHRTDQDSYERLLEEEETKARYAQHAQVEKQTLVNPSNPHQSLKGTNNSQIIRWQHLFPRRLNQHVVKWRSMTTPACLPLTTMYLPSESDLKKQWQEYPYQISISADTASFLVKRASSTHPALAVLREMASQRLAQGFQFIVPTKRVGDDASAALNLGNANGKDVLREPWELFQPGSLASGIPIFLSMTNQIHRISYDRNSNAINVKRFVRRTDYDTSSIEYACCIWSRNLPGYQTVQSRFDYPDFGAYNWTYLDALIAGYNDDEEFGSATKYWRTRFVVVPSEGSPPAMKGPSEEKLSDEEVRLMGMDRLADLFSRARWRSRSNTSSTAPKRGGQQRPSFIRTPTTPLRFIPTSLDPAMSTRDEEFMKRVEVAHQDDSNESQSRKPKKDKTRCVKDLSYVELVKEMYSLATGLKINDRLWNRIMYRESFSGADFITWLCREFDDVKTREEGTEWGNRLIKEGVLQHVNDYHGFLDGHYFYRLTSAYLDKRPSQQDKGWFASTSTTKTRNGSGKEGTDRETGSAARKGGSRKVLMSRSMIIDVDPNRKSDRAEVALLHYDTAHNPANGFNFQIHWLGTTARFIEDLVQSWTRSVERYGLRCIEAPINQIKDVSRHNPFQAPLPISLALHPPTSSTFADFLPNHINPHHLFQYSLLRKFGFILDQEASEKYQNISKEIEIDYKSRPSVFDFSQFVHRSGVAFVQVLKGNDGFLWLDNRLYNSHLHQQQQQQQQQQHHHHNTQQRQDQSEKKEGHQTWLPSADTVRKDFIDFCSDVTKLEAFYRELLDALQKSASQNYTEDIRLS